MENKRKLVVINLSTPDDTDSLAINAKHMKVNSIDSLDTPLSHDLESITAQSLSLMCIYSTLTLIHRWYTWDVTCQVKMFVFLC